MNRVPKLPWVPVQLLHKNTTITTRQKRYIQRCYSTLPLLQHITKRDKWNMETTLNIDWDMHGLLQNKHVKKGTHFSKFVHYNLPTNDRLNKYE